MRYEHLAWVPFDGLPEPEKAQPPEAVEAFRQHLAGQPVTVALDRIGVYLDYERAGL